jgi:uncharacterized RDD family membrane protein YckC
MADPHPIAPGAAPAAATVDMANAHYAGFWIRLVAQIIDGAIIGFATKLIFGDAITTVKDGMVTMSFNNWNTLIPILYSILFWIWIAATPGKFILGLRIVDANGKNITPLGAILRYLGYIVSGIVIGIGFLWIGFDKKKQGWHDKIAKTYVIHKR